MSPASRARPPRKAQPVSPEHRLGGVLAALGLLVGFLGLTLLPGDGAALRIAGVSVLWWYGGVVAPALGVTAMVILRRGREDEADASGVSGDDDGRGAVPTPGETS